jgi:phosphatidylserine/phosphatidylglycerophosphate/cardiolipin synthase-like enzyme
MVLTTQIRTDTIPEGKESLRDLASHASKLDLPQHTSEDPHYDPDIKSEVLRAAAGLNPRPGETRLQATTRLLNTTIQPDTQGSAPDMQPADGMTPYIPIPAHDPVPMAMVCREPWGAPNKHSLHTPQNHAFMSALRHAEKSVMIQTPDLNAEDLLPEIVAACKRGVHVTYYYCLGYNDAGELLPGQGGHNELIAHRLYEDLGSQRDNLDIYTYVAKDQTHPIHNKFKKRSCHIKVMIVDGHIGIQGNGNQDTQSWYHSQEINIMVDSEVIVSKWIEGLQQNENTHIYGQVAKEGPDAGCWKDPETGQQAEGAIGVDPGKFAWAKGVIGAVQRVRGVGGF